jgi:hypothetical protein
MRNYNLTETCYQRSYSRGQEGHGTQHTWRWEIYMERPSQNFSKGATWETQVQMAWYSYFQREDMSGLHLNWVVIIRHININIITSLKLGPNLFLAVMKAQWEESGNNTGGRAVMLSPITYQCLGVLDFNSHIHTVYMNTQFRLAQNSTYDWPTGMCIEECPYAARTHSLHSKVFRKDSKFDWETSYIELSFLVTFLTSST